MTGVILQGQQIFGEDEQRREQLALTTSGVTLEQPFNNLSFRIDAARAALRTHYGNQPVSAIDWHIKGDKPYFICHLDSPITNRLT